MPQQSHLTRVAHEERFVCRENFRQGTALVCPAAAPGFECVDKFHFARPTARAHTRRDVLLKRDGVDGTHVEPRDLANLADDLSDAHVDRSMSKQK